MTGEGGYWTPDRLARLSREIDDFSAAAFAGSSLDLAERKKRMRFISQGCCDQNTAHILGRSIDDLSKRPADVRRAITLARSHVDSLRNSQKD